MTIRDTNYVTLRELEGHLEELKDNIFSDYCEEHEDSDEYDARVSQWAADSGVYDDELEEISQLESFISEVEGYADRDETLISEDVWEDYVKDLAREVCSVDFNTWPMSCIDWEQAAEELAQDYTTAEWDGTTYYFR